MSRLNDAQRKILAHLAQKPGACSTEEIGTAFGKFSAWASTEMQALQKKGLVRLKYKEGFRGFFSITSTGRAAIAQAEATESGEKSDG